MNVSQKQPLVTLQGTMQVHAKLYLSCTVILFGVQYVYNISSQVQRDPRDNEVIREYHKKIKATSIIHTLEPNGKEIGNLTVCVYVCSV